MTAIELLREANAWEGLKRALKNRKLEIEDPGESGRMISIASLRPEPIPLKIKVIIIGTPDIYYLLSRSDPDFANGMLFTLERSSADYDPALGEDQPALLRGHGVKNHLLL